MAMLPIIVFFLVYVRFLVYLLTLLLSTDTSFSSTDSLFLLYLLFILRTKALASLSSLSSSSIILLLNFSILLRIAARSSCSSSSLTCISLLAFQHCMLTCISLDSLFLNLISNILKSFIILFWVPSAVQRCTSSSLRYSYNLVRMSQFSSFQTSSFLVYINSFTILSFSLLHSYISFFNSSKLSVSFSLALLSFNNKFCIFSVFLDTLVFFSVLTISTSSVCTAISLISICSSSLIICWIVLTDRLTPLVNLSCIAVFTFWQNSFVMSQGLSIWERQFLNQRYFS